MKLQGILGMTVVLKQPTILDRRLAAIFGLPHNQSSSWLRHLGSSLWMPRTHTALFQYVAQTEQIIGPSLWPR